MISSTSDLCDFRIVSIYLSVWFLPTPELIMIFLGMAFGQRSLRMYS